MTWGDAYMSFEEDIKGTLEPGKLADIVVLDRSLVSIDEEDIRNVKASITIVGGKAVFENK